MTLDEDHLLYFAYGSNLYTPRLRFRVKETAPICVASLPGHELRFHKKSIDRSAKCDAFRTGVPTDAVLGVVFEVPASMRDALDEAEGAGKGYEPSLVTVETSEGKLIEVMTYRAEASAIVPALPTYTWYFDFVLGGAREHGLPESYVSRFILSANVLPDPKPDRGAREGLKYRSEFHRRASGLRRTGLS